MTTASVDVARFVLNGVELSGQRPAREFHALLGAPTRIVAAGAPAPAGHRNNQVHFYDELVLYLIEHHFTYAIGEIGFVLWPDEARRPLCGELTGEVSVGGARLHAGTEERALLASSIPFEAQIRGQWHLASLARIARTAAAGADPNVAALGRKALLGTAGGFTKEVRDAAR